MSNTQTMSPGIVQAIPKRFTLRGLLLLMLAIGVGLWWWQLPFIVRKDHSRTPVLIPQGIGVGIIPVYEIGTFRRTSPGVITQDGVTRVFDEFDQCIAEETWRNGVLDGPVRRFDAHGYRYETGQYRDGRPHGTWISQAPFSSRIGRIPPYYESKVEPMSRRIVIEFAGGERTRITFEPLPNETTRCEVVYGPNGTSTRTRRHDEGTTIEEVAYEYDQRHGAAQAWYLSGQRRYTGEWHFGKAIGEWTFWDEAGRVQEELSFTDGRLSKRGGQPLTDYPDLLPFVAAVSTYGQPQQLQSPIHLDGPLLDASSIRREPVFELTRPTARLEILARELHAQIDPLVPPEACRSVQVNFLYDGLPAEAALYLALRPHGLAVEYRDEQFCITTLAAAKTWNRDSSLALTATPGSHLAQELKWRVDLDYAGGRLQDLAFQLEEEHRVHIKLETGTGPSEKLEDRRVGLHVKDVSLQAALATLCLLNNLDCEIRNDEVVLKGRSQPSDN